MKFAIIGSPDTILGFKAIGVEPYGINTVDQGVEIINKIRHSKEYGIILITEDWAEKLHNELEILQEQTMPAVIRIPGSQGATGEGLKSLKKIVEKAVGSDMLG